MPATIDEGSQMCVTVHARYIIRARAMAIMDQVTRCGERLDEGMIERSCRRSTGWFGAELLGVVSGKFCTFLHVQERDLDKHLLSSAAK
jgi:hypothetical protein